MPFPIRLFTRRHPQAVRSALHLVLIALSLPFSAPGPAQTPEAPIAIRDRFDTAKALERNACDTDKDRISTGDGIEVCVRRRKSDTRYRLLPLSKSAPPVDSLAADRHRSIAAENPCMRDGHAGCPAGKIILFSTTF